MNELNFNYTYTVEPSMSPFYDRDCTALDIEEIMSSLDEDHDYGE